MLTVNNACILFGEVAVRKSNIKLTMGKNRIVNVYTNIYNRLSLSHVYGHDKTKMNRKLVTGEINRKTL